MRSFIIILVFTVLSGCSLWPSRPPRIAEVEPQLVTDCHFLAVLNETADADRIIQMHAAEEMVTRIKERAVQLGATHLVWHHRTKSSASASVYFCPSSSPSTAPKNNTP